MRKNKPTIVMLFGTFDIFHKGHENFIAQARAYGDYLIAIIARDKTVLKIKGKLPKNDEKKRLDVARQSGLVDKVIHGSLTDKYAAIKKYQPDIICLGYDQTYFTDKLFLEKNLKSKIINLKFKVVRLKPYKPNKYKSSLLTRAALVKK